MVDSGSSIGVDATSFSIVVDSCCASAPASVITVTDSDVPEPAMAVLHTIASSGDDGVADGDDPTTASPTPWSTPSRSIRHRMSWRSSRRRASLQRLLLPRRMHGCAFFACRTFA